MNAALMSTTSFNTALAVATNKGLFQTAPANFSLQQRHRWITVTLANQTEFKIEPVENWFDSGKFWTAPSTCNAMAGISFAACEKDSSFFTGVSGAILYNIAVGQQCFPLSVAFSNPQIGAVKCRAELHPNYEDVWRRMDSGNPYYPPALPLGRFWDQEGRKVDISVKVVSIPGQNSRVEISEGRQS